MGYKTNLNITAKCPHCDGKEECPICEGTGIVMIEEEADVEIEYSVHPGCKATWGSGGGSPSEPAHIEIENFNDIEKIIGREVTPEEIEIIEEKIWEHEDKASEWSD